jgi:hypothetical protein
MSADVRENKRPAVRDRRYSAILSHLQSLSAELAAEPQVIPQPFPPAITMGTGGGAAKQAAEPQIIGRQGGSP